MKQKLQRLAKNLWKLTAVACFLSSASLLNAQTPITVDNGDFELPGTGKITNWQDASIPGWDSDIAYADSGIETNGTTGSWTGYFEGNAVQAEAYNITGHTIAAAGVFYTVKFNAGQAWNSANVTVRLVHANPGTPGTRTVLGSKTVATSGASWSILQTLTVASTLASVGENIGIEVQNEGNDWAAVDNFTLEFSNLSSNADLASLDVTGGTLVPAFNADVLNYWVAVPTGTPSVMVSGTTADAGASITSGDGSITLTGSTTTTDVVVTAEDSSTKTYTVNILEDCFTPYSTGNLVANPSMVGNRAAQIGFLNTWTENTFDPADTAEDACGGDSGSMYIKGTCYPDGGVLEYNTGVAIKPNTTYRIRAQVKNETAASSDVFNFCLNSATWDLTTNDTTGNQTLVGIPTGAGWVQFDQTVTTGPSATGNVGFLIMSCDSADLGLVTDFLYLDNFEIYDEGTLSANDFELNAASFSVFPNPSNGGSFKIALNSFEGSVNVKVYSILGKEVLNKDFASSSKTIEVNHKLNSGLYIVKVNDKATAKLIVK